ncbi:hypothetical protein [Actinoplanes couchii]|uniref:Uncharacterized protein n=1 Tax=Actinoplanes couchii TaxID=403638 RepID=A0ABQ3X0R0_9ACTN|nr:hypothetical protein [Actinoplanes couchii]MDR6316490.1 hypothetical protein [Actinoplanes couchii]GID52105.1 hypothetical protein Aco03nite_005090 [Actinoplanes couchii]
MVAPGCGDEKAGDVKAAGGGVAGAEYGADGGDGGEEKAGDSGRISGGTEGGTKEDAEDDVGYGVAGGISVPGSSVGGLHAGRVAATRPDSSARPAAART